MYDADLPFNTASALRDSLVAGFAAHPDLNYAPDETNSYVYPGLRPLDGCDALSVSIGQIIPATIPNQIPGNEVACAYVTVVEFNVRLQACHPVREDGEALTVEEAGASAQDFYAAAWVMWAEMLNRWQLGTLMAPYVTDCLDVSFDPLEFNNPSGGRHFADVTVRTVLKPVRVST